VTCILVLPPMAGFTSHADMQPSTFGVVPQPEGGAICGQSGEGVD